MKHKYTGRRREGMEVLLIHYQTLLEGETSILGICPLCIGDGCLGCPCPVVTVTGCQVLRHIVGNSAVDLRDGEYGTHLDVNISKQTFTKWYKQRIAQLTEWLAL